MKPSDCPHLLPLVNAVRQELPSNSLRPQKGFTLVETLLGMGIIMGLGVGSFMVYDHLSNNANVRSEQDHIVHIATQTEKAYSATGSFAGLTTAQAISAKVVPNNMVVGNVLRSRWGSDVSVEPVGVDGKANNALKITYDAVPDKACVKLASATAQGAWNIEVNDVSVLDSQKLLDVSKATNLCADKIASKMEFTYYGGASGLAATSLAPVQLAPYVPPAPATPTAPPAPLPAIPPVVVAPGVVTPPSVVPPVVPPITTTPTTPPSTPPPSAPPPVGASCVVPSPSSVNENQNQTGTCPTGQLLVSGASTFQQTRNRTNTASCPDPWGTPVWTNGAWGAWTPQPSAVCAPACVAPAPSSNAQTQAGPSQNQTLGCPAGYNGSIAQSRTVTQIRIANTTHACPAPTGSYTSSTSYGAWSNSSYGAWQTISNNCVPDAPPTTYAWVMRDHVYGPGMGCNLGADQDSAEQMVKAGILLGYGNRPYRSYEVNPANQCTAANDGETINVYRGCGGWQAGLEGYSGFRCEAISGGKNSMWEFVERTAGPTVYNGTIAGNPYPISQVDPTGECSIGQTQTLSGYQWTFQNYQTMRGTVAMVTMKYQCVPFSYPEY